MNIFKQFYRSLYSPKDIASFRFQGVGKTIVYLLLLTIIASIPNLYYISKGINEAVHTLTETMNEEVPPFTIVDSTLQYDQPEPTIIEKSDLTIIIDSSSTYDEDKISSSSNTVALLKDKFVIATVGQTQSFEYASFGNFTLSKDDVVSLLQSMDSMLTVMILILVVIYLLFMFVYKVFQTLVLAIFAQAFSKIFGRNLAYAASWKITVYSTTLPVIFFAIMDSLQTVVPFGSALNWFISLLLVCLAIKEIQIGNTENK